MGELLRNPEQHESIQSKIDLYFMRHGDKEKDPSKSDYDILLTEKGRGQAQAKSHAESLDQSLAYGSPRKRTQETSGLAMSGSAGIIEGTESYEELKEKLDKDLAIGSKIGVDKNLDFILDEESEYGKEIMKPFIEGRLLKWVVEESDRIAEEMHDTEQYSYSRSAKAVAEVILKYLHIAPRWQELSQDTEKYTDTLERYLGTHLGVQESFLAKVIEKMKGVEERDKFVSALNNQGFDFTEGFKAEIQNHSGAEPTIHISYSKEKDGEKIFEFDEDVPSQLLQEIAK